MFDTWTTYQLCTFVGCAVLMLGAVFMLGATFERRSWHRETINRDFAQYNPRTGYWQWLEPLPSPDVEQAILQAAARVDDRAEELKDTVRGTMREPFVPVAAT